MSSGLFELTKGVWTQITTADKSGKVLHLSGDPSVIYMQSPTQPVGYDKSTPTSQVTIARNLFFYNEMAIEDFLWAYSTNSDAVISVTPSDGVVLNTDAPYFTGLRAMVTQSYTEANSKLGVEHEASIIFTAGALSSRDTIFVTGDLPVAIKGRVIRYTGEGITAEIFSGATYTGGTTLEYQNASDINPQIGLSQVIEGASIVGEGDLVFAPDHLIGNTSNQGQGSAGSVIGREKLLKPNTIYLFRLTSLDSQPQDISSLVTWYEGELDLPLA